MDGEAVKRPSFQFYPGDWQSNSKLRRCTHEQKGIWMDVMCVLHDQEEYGVARFPLSEIAQAVGTSRAKLLQLVDKGILKGCDKGELEPFVFTPTGAGRKKLEPVTLLPAQEGPLWYSSRMVEDEYKRTIRGEYGNAPKAAPNNAPKAPIGAAPKTPPHPAPSRADSSSSSSSSVNPSITGGGEVAVVRVEDADRPPPPPDPNGFAMTLEWQPSSHFPTLARQAGLAAPDDATLAEFRSFWLGQTNTLRNQHQWDHALLTRLQGNTVRAAAAPKQPATGYRAASREDGRRAAATTRLSDVLNDDGTPKQPERNDERTIDAPHAARQLG